MEIKELEEIKKLEETLKKYLENLKPELECIELRTINWLDDYNGREPVRRRTFGIKASDDLDKFVTRLLHEAGEGGKAYVYFTIEGVRIQRTEAKYNQFGRWVGTSQWVITLEDLIKDLKEKKTKHTIEELKKVCLEQLQKL